jgi:hypothetical protein
LIFEGKMSGDVLSTVAGAYAAAIFIVVPIDHVVAAVLNTPMGAICLNEACLPRLFNIEEQS